MSEAAEQRCVHGHRYEAGNIAAETGDFANQRRGNEAIFFGRGQEQRFHIRNQVAVHAGELEFVLEIGHRAQAAQQHPGTDMGHEVRQQRIEAANFDVREPRQ
jgi:hypothetical protein